MAPNDTHVHSPNAVYATRAFVDGIRAGHLKHDDDCGLKHYRHVFVSDCECTCGARELLVHLETIERSRR